MQHERNYNDEQLLYGSQACERLGHRPHAPGGAWERVMVALRPRRC